MLLLGLGDGLEDNREAVRLSLEVGDPFAAVALVNLAGLVWENEGPAPALPLYYESIAFAQRRGISGSLRWAKAETTWMYYDLGQWDQIAEVVDEVVASDPERSQVSFLCLPYVALTKVWRGELDDAVTMVQEILPRSREIHDPQILLPALEVAALVAWRLGDTDQAVQLIEEYERETEGRPTWRAMYLPSLVRILTSTDRVAHAERLIEGAAEYGARRAGCLASARAIMTEGKGEVESAAALYDDAAARWAQFGHVLERAQALLGAGRCLIEMGRTGDAGRRLREARELFVSLDARPLIDETDQLLARATALTS